MLGCASQVGLLSTSRAGFPHPHSEEGTWPVQHRMGIHPAECDLEILTIYGRGRKGVSQDGRGLELSENLRISQESYLCRREGS